jgi:lipoate-protein ligase A
MSSVSTSGSLRWHLVEHRGMSGPQNMAWDHTLALECGPESAVLRFYDWSPATLSLGRNEPARSVYSPEEIESQGLGIVRRPTGGRAVLHHRELTYSVCSPIRALGGVRGAYATLNRALATGLRRLGVRVDLAERGPPLSPDAGPCFQRPAEGEVTAGGRKLVGSAQVRMGGTLLQHGSILLHDDQARIARVARGRSEVTGSRPAVLRELLGREVDRDELIGALIAGFVGEVPGDWRGVSGDDRFGSDAVPHSPRADLLEHYASPEWTWRR